MTWWRTGGDYGQPEVKTIPNVDPFIGPPARINSGNYAVQLFTFYRNQDAGFYQVVSGLEPGATVQFSAYAHGYSCNDSGDPYTCGDSWNQVFRVGIEPNGSADAFSPGVVWSADQRAPDTFQLIGPVTAQVGGSGTVTVFLRSKTKWQYKHQDAYWDDTSLVVTAPGVPATATAPPPPPTATPGPPPTPRPTPTPRPDGATVHIVESGDTLLGIALAYDVDVDQIQRLNEGAIGNGGFIVTGQELVISIPAGQPAVTPLPEPPPEDASPEAAEEAPPGEDSGATDGASICVLAYHDRNGDTYLDAGVEELLPNAEFAVADASGVIDQYVSDGLNEPFCFTGLAAGAYHVSQGPPAGYVVSGVGERDVAIVDGASIQIEIGSKRVDGGEVPPPNAEEGAPVSEEGGVSTEPEEDSSDAESAGGASSIFSVVAKVSGVLVLLLAAGIAVLFFLTRQRT